MVFLGDFRSFSNGLWAGILTVASLAVLGDAAQAQETPAATLAGPLRTGVPVHCADGRTIPANTIIANENVTAEQLCGASGTSGTVPNASTGSLTGDLVNLGAQMYIAQHIQNPYGAVFASSFTTGLLKGLFGNHNPQPQQQAQHAEYEQQAAAARAAAEESLRQQQLEQAARERAAAQQRLDAIFARLDGQLKLSGGTTQLALKTGEPLGQLHLKMGDSQGGQGYGIPGLDGVYTGGARSSTDGGGGGLKLKLGDPNAANSAAPAPAPGMGIAGLPGLNLPDNIDLNHVTPQQAPQVADAAIAVNDPQQRGVVEDISLKAAEKDPTLIAKTSDPLVQEFQARDAVLKQAEQTNQKALQDASAAQGRAQADQTALTYAKQQMDASPASEQVQQAYAQMLSSAGSDEEVAVKARQIFDSTEAHVIIARDNAVVSLAEVGEARSEAAVLAKPVRFVAPKSLPTDGPVLPAAQSTITVNGRTYTYAGNGLVAGTGWKLFAHRQPGEPEKRMCDAIALQSQLAGAAFDEGVDCKRYDFVVGMATSIDDASNLVIGDLKGRVLQDEETNGQFTANSGGLYNRLIGMWFHELGCHSNGAMICLAALERGDVHADHVVLYGPQVTRDSLGMWDRLVTQGKVKSVTVYLDENDIVPGSSITYMDLKQARSVTSGKSLYDLDTLTKTFQTLAPDVTVHTFSCKLDRSSVGCHALSMYKAKVNCTGRSAGPDTSVPQIPGRYEVLPEPPLPCEALGAAQ